MASAALSATLPGLAASGAAVAAVACVGAATLPSLAASAEGASALVLTRSGGIVATLAPATPLAVAHTADPVSVATLAPATPLAVAHTAEPVSVATSGLLRLSA